MAEYSSPKLAQMFSVKFFAFLVVMILFLAMFGSVTAGVPLSSKGSSLIHITCRTYEDCVGPACICDRGLCFC